MFEGLVSSCQKPEKCKELYSLFADSLAAKVDSIAASDEIADKVYDYLEWRQIYPRGCVDLLGNISSLMLRRNLGRLPKGWQILLRLSKDHEVRPQALKNIVLLDSQELLAFLGEEEFEPLEIDMLQEGVELKLAGFQDESSERLELAAVAVLAICTVSPSLWPRLYVKSSKFDDRVW